MIIKASDYKYPSRDELVKIYAEEPILSNFGFPYVNEMESLFTGESDFKTVHRSQHLYWWDNVLVNRIGNLSRTYAVALVNFDRGFSDDFKEMKEEQYINRFQFELYAENYYYFFSSIKDTVAQIINVYFNLEFAEDSVYLGKLTKKLTNQSVNEALLRFKDDTVLTTEYRNAFTHRFPITQVDYRPQIDSKNTKYYSMEQPAVKSSILKSDILQSFLALSVLLDKLRVEMR
ncbi:Cthe_2314 family HEPN domain-containing protein [Pedobacter sp. UC225_65]|uniref:Cthe_2314 family HEPN domain-containing protein n=1 Tax=Pedobacter sp. UC225_65 TaxID=3350173 RepID=UPI00366A79CE